MNQQQHHYHFIGVGGVGMGTLAMIMLAKGHKVSGSDLKESAFCRQLREKGADIHIGHDAAHIDNPDFVIYSSAVKKDNPEKRAAKAQKIPVKKRAELLAELVNEQISVTIAGAHGKTTTTSMIGHCLLKAGFDPTIMVGGIIRNDNYHANLGSGKFFVTEVDESDGSFLFFKPYYSVITNIDFEHVDYYHTWHNIMEAYGRFIRQTQPDGCVIAFGEDERLAKLLQETKINFMTYGRDEKFDIYAKNPVFNGYRSAFECVVNGKTLGTIELNVPGEHNMLNALACIAVGLNFKIDFGVIAESLLKFNGVERRFQLKAEANGITVIDDYGHHPTEITATLKAARLFKKSRLVTVFQPHRYSRTKLLMDEFVQSLSLSDYLILTDIYAASERPIKGVNSEVLYDQLKKITTRPVVYLKKEEILKHLTKMARPGDMVVFLGAGDITTIGQKFAQHLTDSVMTKTLIAHQP